MYQALYRKYRPRSFDDVCGQDHITDTLKAQVASGRLSHAYLFIGTRGTGKTTCAKILAKAVNCESPENGNPCNKCPACLGIDGGSIMDVVEIDAASNNSVDNVRSLRDEAVYSPSEVNRRVYIIDEVHMLSTAAFNALLKILEEPPEHLLFILATTELRKIPATILSRCQRYSFHRLAADTVSERLSEVARAEGLRLTDGAAALLGRLADGAMRDGLSLLDQCSGAENIDESAVLSAMGIVGSQRIEELLAAITSGNVVGTLELFRRLWDEGKDPAGLLSELCTLMRDILILSVAPKGGESLLSGSHSRAALVALGSKSRAAELLRMVDIIQGALASIKDNPSPRIAAELCLVSLCAPETDDSVAGILARVERLEQGFVPTPAPSPSPVTPAKFVISPEEERPAEVEAFPAHGGSRNRQPDSDEISDFPDESAPVPNPEPRYGELADDEPFVLDEPPSAPEVKPEPTLVAAPQAPASNDFWNQFLTRTTAILTPGAHSLLINPAFTLSGELQDGALEISMSNSFSYDMLSKPEIIESLGALATELAGRPVQVRFIIGEATASGASRDLNELKQFSEVKFI